MLAINSRVIIDRYDDADVFFYLMRALRDISTQSLLGGPPSTFEVMDAFGWELEATGRTVFTFNDFQVHISELKDLVFLEEMLDFYEIRYCNLNGEDVNDAQHTLLEEWISW